MANQAQFTKHSYALENLGIDYSFHSHGLSVEIESWTRAFKAVGFKRVDREVAEKLLPFDRPEELQDANTYNDTTIISGESTRTSSCIISCSDSGETIYLDLV